jgi:Mn-containing catalase
MRKEALSIYSFAEIRGEVCLREEIQHPPRIGLNGPRVMIPPSPHDRLTTSGLAHDESVEKRLEITLEKGHGPTIQHRSEWRKRNSTWLETPMYHHVKKLMYTVKIGEPDVRFGNMLLEQFGGANGELAAAMQYTIQGWNCVDDLGRRDLLLDIGTEELSHLEVVGALIRMHLKPLKTNREAAEADPLITIAGGGGVALFDSMGNPWTSTYLKITGELDVDLRSNIAAESRAKIVYERLIDHTDDPGTIDTLQFLMTREITHMKAFQAALDSLEKKPFSIGRLLPTPGIVDEYFNGSTGDGSEGDTDMRGPWSASFGLEQVESELTGGPGLSIQDIDGKLPGEGRGKQDDAQKATTSAATESIGEKSADNGTQRSRKIAHKSAARK